VDYPRNWHELLAWFPDEAACLRYLERLRWGAGFSCRFCGTIGARWWRMGDGLRRCAVCRAETSVTAGTIFAGTRLPLVTWFAAVWYVVNQKQGVSALGLQRVLGIGSYQTAWAWLHKLRRAMVRPDRGLLAGVVEVDETIIGGVRAGWRGRGHPEKALVAIAVEQRDRGLGRVRMQRIANASKETLTDFVLDHLEPGAEVHTDGWAGYVDLAGRGYQHRPRSQRANPDEQLLPRVHRAISNLKSWLRGTHRGVSSSHLQVYLDEYVFRFNRRGTPMAAFQTLLGLGTQHEPTTYHQILARPERTG